MTTRPLVVTAGEPAGIGPDLCIAIAERAMHAPLPDFVVVGDVAGFEARARLLDANITVTASSMEAVLDRPAAKGELRVVDFPYPAAVVPGCPDSRNARALLDGLRAAAAGCLDGNFLGLVTAPVAKRVINDAGIPFSGHTELLAELTGATQPVMLLVGGNLRVALATTHLPLRNVADNLSKESLAAVIEVLHADLQQRFGIDDPEIIVCGLNPHAGEGGHLGHEDDEIIAPVVNDLVNAGMKLRGPLPADTAFTPAAGTSDAVLAMYHDQGLPVLKYAGFGNAVNVTLGLPIVRTSVDHGTAFDLAGSGKADSGSLLAALELAAKLSCRA